MSTCLPSRERRRREVERRAGKLGKSRREEGERMASNRAMAAISSAADNDEDLDTWAAAGPGDRATKKPAISAGGGKGTEKGNGEHERWLAQ